MKRIQKRISTEAKRLKRLVDLTSKKLEKNLDLLEGVRRKIPSNPLKLGQMARIEKVASKIEKGPAKFLKTQMLQSKRKTKLRLVK